MLTVAIGLFIYGALFGREQTGAIMTGGAGVLIAIPALRGDERRGNGGNGNGAPK